MKQRLTFTCAALIATILASSAVADLQLAPLFTDHMVMQRETTAAIWGWDDPGAAVKVAPSWGEAVQATADDDGRWQAAVKTPGAGGPHSITITGPSDEIVLGDVLVGEVWICSGQSNMEWPMKAIDNAEQEIAASDLPQVRLFDVPRQIALRPMDRCGGTWQPCTPASARDFSAVGLLFGRELHAELDVPIGLISTNWGGTVAEAWTSSGALRKDFGEFSGALDAIDEAATTTGTLDGFHPNAPTALFNGMIAPLVPYAARGAIWYQGESNRGRAEQYRRLFPAMISDWRNHWNTALAFYYVQIAPFGYGNDTGEAAELREAQAMVSLPDTGMAVTMDIGNAKDIHPRNKQPVGHRLALLALAGTYGRSDLECRGPTYTGMIVEGDAVRLSFAHADGVNARGQEPDHFEIAGADGVFHPAGATIDGTSIVVRSDAVAEPVAVRYAWGAADAGCLWNGAGLPASSFRTKRDAFAR